jgi:hypothetical protein
MIPLITVASSSALPTETSQSQVVQGQSLVIFLVHLLIVSVLKAMRQANVNYEINTNQSSSIPDRIGVHNPFGVLNDFICKSVEC